MVIETGNMTSARDSTRTRNVSRTLTQLQYQQARSFGSKQLRRASEYGRSCNEVVTHFGCFVRRVRFLKKLQDWRSS